VRDGAEDLPASVTDLCNCMGPALRVHSEPCKPTVVPAERNVLAGFVGGKTGALFGSKPEYGQRLCQTLALHDRSRPPFQHRDQSCNLRPGPTKGIVFALSACLMKSERKTLDQRPGAVPEIRADGDVVFYCLDVRTEHARLIIRCDPNGNVSASLEFEPSARARA